MAKSLDKQGLSVALRIVTSLPAPSCSKGRAIRHPACAAAPADWQRACWAAWFKSIGNRVNSMPFQKGQSGNPTGRPKIDKSIQELARLHCPDALRTLAVIMKNSKAPAAARALCANSLLNRGYGLPAQSIEYHIPAEFERMSDRELLEQLSRQANEMGVNVTLTYDFGQGDEAELPKLIEGVASRD